MKNSLILLSIFIGIVSTYKAVADTKSRSEVFVKKPVNVKCFVEFVGGGEAISLWKIDPSLINNLAHTIVGQEVLIIPRESEKDKKNKLGTIYIANECIFEEEQFTSPRARALDKETPR